MKREDLPRFTSLLQALAATFRVEPSEALAEGYWMALDDMPIEAVERAVRSAMRGSERMPMASEIRKLGGEMATGSRAVLAWGSVVKAIGQHGHYRSVNFDDPVINATLRNLGGWQQVCATTEDELKWLRKDFERIYSSLCNSGVSPDACAYLVGAHEQNNQASGHAIAPPTTVRTGLPPHREGVVKQLEAPQRLELGPAEAANRERVREMVGALVGGGDA